MQVGSMVANPLLNSERSECRAQRNLSPRLINYSVCFRGTFGTLKEVWNNILVFTMGKSQIYTQYA